MAVPIAILDIALTVIPFLFFIIPFLIFTRVFKKRYNWKNLFRLFIIIKLQFIPIFILLFLLAQSVTEESLYLITDNFIWLIWIALIITFPSIINIAFWKKAIWILVNYLFFLLTISLLAFSMERLDKTGRMFSKLSIISPNTEYSLFESKGLYSPLLFDDRHYFVLAQIQYDSSISLSKTQFVNSEFRLSFLKTEIKKLESTMKIIDSLSNPNGMKRNAVNKKADVSYEIKEFSFPFLDSFRNDLNSKFSLLLAETMKMKDSSKFESNREYFNILTDYLKLYELSYTDSNEINKIIKTSTIESTIRFDANDIGVMFKVDSTYYGATKKKLQLVESNFADRKSNSTFLFDVLFFPFDLFVEKLE
ncbi:hypothetical protein A3860_39290 [Niastella vici]|uniref:Uncharacterized protein n=1 Tax=Niastella vici TaxID=1703345 RepID=A0A1V9FKV6_9BACT|nr:hypothetical protein A3860_39290 [Niastella vici]